MWYDACILQRRIHDQRMFFIVSVWLYLFTFLDVCALHLQPVSTKAEGSGRMPQHLQGHLDLQQQQLVAAVLISAGPVLLPGLLVAKQLKTQGSLLLHWEEHSQ